MDVRGIIDKIKKEVAKLIVGQEETVDGMVRALLSDGHVLLEGVPGIGKTLLVRALGEATGCSVKRIQFTVDLLPTDITGITAYNEKTKEFYIVKGPIFANFVIADEINRAPPKTQSALLEAMQEKQVTIGKQTFKLQLPFFVMANQNPIETAGVYTLPEAQVDRFLFKLNMFYPSNDEEKKIIEQNISLKKFEEYEIKAVTNQEQIVGMQELAKKIKHTEKIKEYIVRIAEATRNPAKHDIKLGQYIEYGASPRACIGLFIGAKASALMKGDSFIKPEHIKNVAYDVLRHRIILSYRARAEGVKTEDVIKEVLAKVPI